MTQVAIFAIIAIAAIAITWLLVAHRCKHKWKKIATTKYSYGSMFRLDGGKDYVYTLDVMCCESCGKIKKIEY